MIVFLDEDRSYLSWLAHHRHGFVLDWLRRPTHKHPTIHRANCAEIKTAKSKRTHWTTGRHLKACSLDLDELVAWAKEEGANGVEYCQQCRPNETVPTASHDRHLTKLGKEVVDFVIEAAVVHLDEHDAGYRMTVADIAQCLDKTPGQISATLRRLVEDGYLRLEGEIAAGDVLPDGRRVFPTVESLRSLPGLRGDAGRSCSSGTEVAGAGLNSCDSLARVRFFRRSIPASQTLPTMVRLRKLLPPPSDISRRR